MQDLENKKTSQKLPSSEQNFHNQAAPLFQIPLANDANGEVLKKKYQSLKDKIEGVNINGTTPLQALQILAEIQEKTKNENL